MTQSSVCSCFLFKQSKTHTTLVQLHKWPVSDTLWLREMPPRKGGRTRTYIWQGLKSTELRFSNVKVSQLFLSCLFLVVYVSFRCFETTFLGMELSIVCLFGWPEKRLEKSGKVLKQIKFTGAFFNDHARF